MQNLKSLRQIGSILVALIVFDNRPAFGQAQYECKILFEMNAPSTFVYPKPAAPETFWPGPATNGQAVATMSDQAITHSQPHAFLWYQNGDPIDLNPTAMGINISGAIGTDGSQQVGWYSNSGNQTTDMHAMLWNGSAASAVDLTTNILGITSSYAYATNAGQQLGIGFTPTGGYGLVWDGTAQSARAVNGEPLATNGAEQVGDAVIGSVGHPFLWKGIAETPIDLTPAQFGTITNGWATDISPTGSEITGVITTADGNGHDILWSRDGATATDITPQNLPYLDDSKVMATNGTDLVGDGIVGNLYHPLVWVNGDPSDVIDLNSTLPSQFDGAGVYSIDASGNIFGLALGPGQIYSVIEWSPVPEPMTAQALILVGIALRRRRKDVGD